MDTANPYTAVMPRHRPIIVFGAEADMLLDARLDCSVNLITITRGDAVTGVGAREYRVRKRDFASTIQVLLQSNRLKIATELPLAKTLTGQDQGRGEPDRPVHAAGRADGYRFPGKQVTGALDVIVAKLRDNHDPEQHDNFITPALITADNLGDAERVAEAGISVASPVATPAG